MPEKNEQATQEELEKWYSRNKFDDSPFLNATLRRDDRLSLESITPSNLRLNICIELKSPLSILKSEEDKERSEGRASLHSFPFFRDLLLFPPLSPASAGHSNLVNSDPRFEADEIMRFNSW